MNFTPLPFVFLSVPLLFLFFSFPSPSAANGSSAQLSSVLSTLWQLDEPNRQQFARQYGETRDNQNHLSLISALPNQTPMDLAFNQLCEKLQHQPDGAESGIHEFLHLLNSTAIFRKAAQFYSDANSGSDLLAAFNTLFFTPASNPPFHALFCRFSPDSGTLRSFIRDRQLQTNRVVKLNTNGNQQDVLIHLSDTTGTRTDGEETAKLWKRRILLGTSVEFEMTAIGLCELITEGGGGEAGWKHCSASIGQGKQLLLALKTEKANQKEDQQNGQAKIAAYFLRIGSASENTAPRFGGGKQRRPKPKPKPNADLQKLMEEMWEMDAADRMPPGTVKFNWQGHLRQDQVEDISPDPLFAYVNESFLQRPLYAALVEMYKENAFHQQVCEEEPPMDEQRHEKFAKLWALITGSGVFKRAYQYLDKQNKTGGDFDQFCAKLFDLWFGTYSRCKNHRRRSDSLSLMTNGGSDPPPHLPLGSSGFEHVFSGEWRQGIVEGHHNWVRFYLQEKAGDINYHGYFGHGQQQQEGNDNNKEEDYIGTFQYKWKGFLKRIGGFFFQTSPAFDFSVFTVCALTAPGNEQCQFDLFNTKLFVTSFTQSCQNGTCVATTYPGTWY